MEDKKVFLRNFLEFGTGVSTRDAMRRYSDEDFNREMQKDLNMSDIAMGRGDVPKKDIDDYEKRRQKEYDDYNDPKYSDPLTLPVDLAKRQKAVQLASFYLKNDPSDPFGNYTPKQYFPPYGATDGLILRDKDYENKMFQMFGGFNPDLVRRRSSNNYG